MANKYIRHGATYCGDGATPNLAASNGAPGAWNNINILEGTTPPYGALAAGDVVYIRAKDASNNAILRAPSANGTLNLGSTAATATSPITWIVDNAGEVWSGVTGSIVYNYHTPSYSWTVTLRSYNNLFATVQDGIEFRVTNTSGTDSSLLILNGNTKNVWHNLTAQNNATYNYSSSVIVGPNTIHWNLHHTRYKPGPLVTNSPRAMIGTPISAGRFVLVNPQIELLNAVPNGQQCFGISDGYSQLVHVIGGRVYGLGATSGQALLMVEGTSTNSRTFRIDGFKYPKEMNVFVPGYEPAHYAHQTIITNADDQGGAHYETGWGYVTSRSDNNPPTLSATLPDGANTPWAWRMYPRNTTYGVPADLTLSAFYQDATAQRTITLEFLVEANLTPLMNNCWIDVSYTDASGTKRVESTYDVNNTNAVPTSTANWTTTSWYLANFSKWKLTLTTSQSVKQWTMITVRFATYLKASTALQVLFINPEFSVA